MNDYAFVTTCNPGYSFNLIATMNSQKYFGTKADWQVVDAGFSVEQKEKISKHHSVYWTPFQELFDQIEDRRLNNSNRLHTQWLAYWLLGYFLLKEKKYKAICFTQGDSFTFVNLNEKFKQAESKLIYTEPLNCLFEEISPEDDRNNTLLHFGIFGPLTFIGRKDYKIPLDFVHFHEEIDQWIDKKMDYLPLIIELHTRKMKSKLIGLNADQWNADMQYHLLRYIQDGDKVFLKPGIQLCSWHRRWWHPGTVLGEYRNGRKLLKAFPNNDHNVAMWDNQEHNFNFVKSFMERFNNMIPEIASDQYVKGFMRRPRYELGEEE